MTELLVQSAGGSKITSIEDWRILAPPKKGDDQWRPGRSARESACAWFRTGVAAVPAEIAVLLDSRPETAGFVPKLAIPELVTRLDEFRGEHRNHDLVVLGTAAGGRTLIAIEAKADEPFGPTVEAQFAAGLKRPGSRVPDRVRALATGLFGAGAIVDGLPGPAVAALRYQLLTAVAGTLIEALSREAEQAVFVVHEFSSEADVATGYVGTRPALLEENSAAFARFLQALGADAVAGTLAGPFDVGGGRLIPHGIPLFVGMASVVIKPLPPPPRP